MGTSFARLASRPRMREDASLAGRTWRNYIDAGAGAPNAKDVAAATADEKHAKQGLGGCRSRRTEKRRGESRSDQACCRAESFESFRHGQSLVVVG